MTPKPFQKIQNLLTEGLFVASVVLLGSLFFFMFALRSEDLIDLGKFLPEDNTLAMLTVDLAAYEKGAPEPSPLLSQLLGVSLREQMWFKGQVGLVWMQGGQVQFVEVGDRGATEAFLKGFLSEGEVLKVPEENPRVTCFSYSHPECYAFTGPFLIVSASSKAITEVLEAPEAPTLRQNPNYQNVKGRLPLLSDGFVYVNAKTSRQAILSAFGRMGIHEPGYFETVLRLFPAYGMTLRMQNGMWSAESVTLADKSQLNGAPYAHPKSKYHARLLEYSSEGFFLEWGGVNLWEQQEALEAVLETLNSTAALTFRASLEAEKQKFFGDLSLEELRPLLEKEFYFAWTPGGGFLLILETDQAVPTFQADFEVFSTQVNGLLVLSSSQEGLQATVDKVEGRQEKRVFSELSNNLSGADEFWRFDLEFLPEKHILKTLLKNVDSVLSTRKRFDDGFYTRHTLIFRP